MAITTLDGVISGVKPPSPFSKTGITMAAVGVAQRGYTPWYHGALPAIATAPSPGINGAAVSGISASNTGLNRTNPGSGNSYLGRLSACSSQIGMLWLIDRLWHNSGLSVTSTGAQAITPATLPARSSDGTTNGPDVLAAIEWSATGGAGTPLVTLTYTDQSGNTGATSTFTGVASPPVGTFEIFGLAAGDSGIRAPTSFIQNATRTSGTMHLVLFRLIASLECSAANTGFAIDALTGGFPRVYDDSCLQLVWFPSSTTALSIVGSYVETQG